MYLFASKKTTWSTMYSSLRYMVTNKYLKNRKYVYKQIIPNAKKKYILYNKQQKTVFCSPYHKQPLNYKNKDQYKTF